MSYISKASFIGRTLGAGSRAALLGGAALFALAPAQAQQTSVPEPQADNSVPPESSAETSTATPNQTTRTVTDGQQTIVVTARRYVPTSSISATKTDIPLIETPQSVSVVTRDQIDLLNFTDVQQAVRYSSGVVGENYGADPRYDFLTVRGFTPKQYIDGLAAPISTSIFSVGVDLYGFEGVDVLKGPSSVLYGNSPPGGLFNLTSRRPNSDFGGEAGFRYGSYDTYQGNMTLTGPIADGVDARITALYRDYGTTVDKVRAKRLYAAPAVTVKLGNSTRVTGLAYYQYDRINGDYAAFLPVEGTLLPNLNGRISIHRNLGEPDYNRYTRHQSGLGFELMHDFGNHLLFHSNTKWFDYEEDLFRIYATGLDDDKRTVTRSNFPYAEDVHEFATDNRFDARLDTGPLNHQLLAGIDYRRVANTADFGFSGASSIDLYDPVYSRQPIAAPPLSFVFNHQRLKQTGVYGQDEIKLADFILTLSGRYDWANILNRTNQQTTKQHKFTYRAGASYLAASGIAPYVSYATSFEPVLGTDAKTGASFRPSTGRQIEGGIKFDGRDLGPDFKIFATVAAYDIKQTNLVTISSNITPVSGTQTGAVEVYGAEAEIVARIREQLSINGSYTYTHSEVTKNGDFPGAVGAPLPVTPKHKASLLVDYTLQKGSLGGLGAGVGARYVSNSAGALPDAFTPVIYRAGKATLFDVIVHYDLPDWRFALNGSNIFNKIYIARCASTFNCAYGADRQLSASITRKF